MRVLQRHQMEAIDPKFHSIRARQRLLHSIRIHRLVEQIPNALRELVSSIVAR